MTTLSKVLVATALLSSLAIAWIIFALSGCVLSESQARQMILAELARAKLDPRFLQSPTQASGSCSFDFEYEGGGRKISYVVMEDWLHGPELAKWDYAENANGP